MLYHWYELSHAAMKPARAAADSCKVFFNNPLNPITHTAMGRGAAAACEVFERTTRRYDKPTFGIDQTIVEGRSVGVEEVTVWRRPFCRLLHFKRNLPPLQQASQPRVLLVAPMSGHYATLLRGTVETLLPNHEVYITDWQDARAVPLNAGRFDLEDYTDYIREMLGHFDGDVHVMAVCQPSVPVLSAVALMEADNDPSVPCSLILLGGPIDTRISPTAVNKLAERRGIDWFRRHVITSVPWPSLGFGRRVYPGFLQLTGFMTMNLDRHVNAHKNLFMNLVKGDGDSAEKHRDFYDEYLAVMDLTAEFYLQTIERVFVRHDLPRGRMRHRDRFVDTAAINRVALMTVEGGNDDITGLGQCEAAHNLCANVPTSARAHYEAPGVGHYGIFNGQRFHKHIAPRIANFIRTHDRKGRACQSTKSTPMARANGFAIATVKQNFTAAAANDAGPPPARPQQTLRVGPANSTARRSRDHRGESVKAEHMLAMPFLFWSLAGRLFVDGMANASRSKKSSQREQVVTAIPTRKATRS